MPNEGHRAHFICILINSTRNVARPSLWHPYHPLRIFLVSRCCARRLSCRVPTSLVSTLMRDYTFSHLRSTSVSPSSSPSPLWFIARAFNCGPRDGVHANVARRDGMGIAGAAYITVAVRSPELSSLSAKPPYDPDAPRTFIPTISHRNAPPRTRIQLVRPRRLSLRGNAPTRDVKRQPCPSGFSS